MSSLFSNPKKVTIVVEFDDGRRGEFEIAKTDAKESRLTVTFDFEHHSRDTTNYEVDTFSRREPTGLSDATLDLTAQQVTFIGKIE